jgi:surface antigen
VLNARPNPDAADFFAAAFGAEAPAPASPSASFPTRRELREIHAETLRKRPRRVRRAARVAAPAYALPYRPKTHKKRFRGLITIAAVTGLFASAGLPAYALSTTDAPQESVLAANTLAVSATAKLISPDRESFSATTRANLAQQRSDAQRDANYTAYMASGALAAGDDYPWFSELSNNQGGGLSPLNYFYRECVDFVAWRLNVDAGSTQAPFKYDWHNLTPGGGNAYQWKSAWDSHGWATGTTPQVGSVAWFGFHVAYVSAVNADGTVTLEEYNYASDHLYGVRTIPATDVLVYLYAPPR